jgi:hypothetical protein
MKPKEAAVFGRSGPPDRNDGPYGDVLQRNIWWSMVFAQLMASDANLRARIPEGSSILLMPAGDEELIRHNHDLLRAQVSDEAVLVVRIAIDDSTVAFRPPGSDHKLKYPLA